MPFTQELVFGPYASGIWTESPQIEYRTIMAAGTIGTGSLLLLEDGVSPFLLEDGTGSILLEG